MREGTLAPPLYRKWTAYQRCLACRRLSIILMPRHRYLSIEGRYISLSLRYSNSNVPWSRTKRIIGLASNYTYILYKNVVITLESLFILYVHIMYVKNDIFEWLCNISTERTNKLLIRSGNNHMVSICIWIISPVVTSLVYFAEVNASISVRTLFKILENLLQGRTIGLVIGT